MTVWRVPREFWADWPMPPRARPNPRPPAGPALRPARLPAVLPVILTLRNGFGSRGPPAGPRLKRGGRAKGVPPRKPFQSAVRAVQTPAQTIRNDNVPDVGSAPGRAAQDFAFHDDTAADTGSQREHHQMPCAAAGAVPEL